MVKNGIAVQSIKKIEYTDTVYNLHIDDNHNYIANDCNVSNCHGASSSSMIYIMESSTKASTRIGTTGTLNDDDKLTETTVQGLFGPIIRSITTRELIDSGRATDVEIEAIKLIYSKEDKILAAKLKREYPEEMDYLSFHPKRLMFISKLASKLQENTLVLFKGIEHGKLLHKELQEANPGREVRLVYGKIKTDERDQLRELMETSTGVIGVCSYATFATGTNIKNLHNLIFAAPIKAQIKVLQSIGRILRLHNSKDVARLFDIGDDLTAGKIFKNHAYRHFISRLEYYLKSQLKFKIREVQL
jgi:superfamily II DNA or RNA helicase